MNTSLIRRETSPINNKYIAFYCPDIYPFATAGLEIHTYHIVKYMCTEQEVLLFTECNDIRIDNLNVIRILSRIFAIKRYNLAALSHLISILYYLITKGNNIKIFYVPYSSNTSHLALIFPIIKKLFGINYILVLHSGIVKASGEFFLHRHLFDNAKKIVTVSDGMKYEYEKRIHKTVVVIPSIIPFRKSLFSKESLRKKYGFNKTDRIVIMVGTLKIMKGNDIVLRAFINLGKSYIENHKLNFIFVGSGALEGQLKIVAKKSNVEEYVHFLGEIENENIHEIYAIADIYIIASWYESLSISMLEAMYNEIAIIASDVNVLNSIIKNNESGLLFEKSNENDLRNKLSYLVENPKIASQLAAKSKKTFDERYDYRKSFTEYRDLLMGIN